MIELRCFDEMESSKLYGTRLMTEKECKLADLYDKIDLNRLIDICIEIVKGLLTEMHCLYPQGKGANKLKAQNFLLFNFIVNKILLTLLSFVFRALNILEKAWLSCCLVLHGLWQV